MTKERLAEIESRSGFRTSTDWRAFRCGHTFPILKCEARVCLARDACTDIPDLIAYVRKLEEKIEQLELLESRSAVEAERLRKQWGYRNPEFLEALESSAAGATDLMNQWARQSYVQEAEDERGLHELAKRLRDAAMAEAKRERKRAEFWRAECQERVTWIEESWQEGNYCPSCALVVNEHMPNCPLSRLMTMPEEPKP